MLYIADGYAFLIFTVHGELAKLPSAVVEAAKELREDTKRYPRIQRLRAIMKERG